MRIEVAGVLTRLRVVPVAVVERVDVAWPLAQALKAGGLPCVEVTFRTAAAPEVIRQMAKDADVLVGAGTILRSDQVDEAVEAGARFIVTPGFSKAVVERCAVLGVSVIPGVATPTEVMMALDAGLRLLKFFPASASGGVSTVLAMAAPFPDVRFIPTGGVTPSNITDYLSLPSVAAVGGTWLTPSSLVNCGRFDDIRRLTAETVALAHRGGAS